MAKIETKPADAEELVKDRLKELISFREENQDIKDVWGKQFDVGLAWVHFPEGSGGLNVNPKFQLLVNETLRNEGISTSNRIANLLGIGMGAPTIKEYGTQEQIDKYLRPMFTADEIWCQLFSEPSAGSDVAGLRSKAVQKGDKWIINGQKVWTSGAHFSDYGILVVRHDPDLEKHKGMTFFFVDMKSPGIEVKPIKQITGGSSFNEVYFTDGEIPDSQRLGEIGDGWKVAITTLMNERLAVGDAGGADVEDAFRWAKTQDNLGEPLLNNKAARESIADWYCEKSGLKNTKLRTMSALSRGDTPGPEASITKIVSAGKLQTSGNFGIDSLDMAGMLRTDNNDVKGFQNAWLGAPGMRIAGGTDEILRNIIAERVLGLPQDPRADKGVAFKDIPSGNS